MGNPMDNQPLATELIRELKAQSKRWFIIAIIELFIIIATVFGFLWYITLPISEVSVDSKDGGVANYVGGNVSGGLYNGENSSKTQTSTEQSKQQ